MHKLNQLFIPLGRCTFSCRSVWTIRFTHEDELFPWNWGVNHAKQAVRFQHLEVVITWNLTLYPEIIYTGLENGQCGGPLQRGRNRLHWVPTRFLVGSALLIVNFICFCIMYRLVHSLEMTTLIQLILCVSVSCTVLFIFSRWLPSYS